MTEQGSDAPPKAAPVQDAGDSQVARQDTPAEVGRGNLQAASQEQGDREMLASLTNGKPNDFKLPADGKLNLADPDVFAASGERGMAAAPGKPGDRKPAGPEGPKPEFKTTAEQVNNVPVGDGKVTDRKLVNEDRSLEGKTPAEVNAAYSAERERLLKDVSPDKLQATKDAMAALEDPNRQPPLTQQELARIYKATSDVIEGKNGTQPPVLNDAQRQLMAQGILDNVAHTKDIDQGYNSTCQVTAMEENMATKDPAAYAEMMSDVARNMKDGGQLHGRDVVTWQAPNGQTITMDKQSVMPDREALNGQVDGQRNYSSQMFDNMIINQQWQSHNPGSLYLKTNPTQPGDTGERLLDSEGRVKGNAPSLVATQLAEMGQNLGLGDKNKPFLITNGNDGNYSRDGVARINSEQDLQNVLAQADQNGGYPIMIMVHTGHAMFRGTEDQGGSGGNEGGWHMVSITGKNPDGTYQMSNQWGKAQDQNVSVHDLYNATRGPQEAGAEGYNGRGTNPNGGGGGDGGNGGNGGGNGNRGVDGQVKDGMLRYEDNKELQKDMGKTGKDADEAAQRQIDAIKAKIAGLKGTTGHEAEIQSLEGQITILSSQAYRN